jgi:glycosyltransferase involved in cell wall biosynthesis
LLFVGAVGSRKRPDLVISALEVLLQHGVDCQLILLGPDREPEWTSRINARIQALANAGRLLWTKHSDDPETFYKMADLFVLPSASEGLANSVLEAMSSGLPCIVSSSSGMRDMIKGPECNGYVLDSSTANSIAAAAKTVFTTPHLFRSLSAGARQHAIRTFDSRRILEEHLAAFAEAKAARCQQVPPF